MKRFLFLLFSCYVVNSHAATCFPGENLWQLEDDICTHVQSSNAEIEASLEAMYTLASTIGVQIDNLSSSSLESIIASLQFVISDLDVIGSQTEITISHIEGLSSQLETVLDSITMLEGIISFVVTGVCSCIDSAVQSADNALASTIDTVLSDIDFCCSSLSMLDVIIKSDIDSIPPKLDAISGVINACCSTLSVLDTIIKSDIDVITSKIETIPSQISVVESDLDVCCSVINFMYVDLVGIGITQAMTPYTITTPGHYYLCGSVTTSGAPAITIAASNVTLDLNGHTITSTDNVGIQCLNNSNINIRNGTIQPFLQGLLITNGRFLELKDLTVLNAASISIDIEDVANVVLENCTVNGTNGQLIANPISAGVYLLPKNGGCRIVNCAVLNQTGSGADGFYIANIFFVINTTIIGVEFLNCTADNIANCGFCIDQSSGGNSFILRLVLSNCVASNAVAYGFSAIGISGVLGPIYENCTARTNNASGGAIGFYNNGLFDTVYRNCVSDSNGVGFLGVASAGLVYESCMATNNSSYGFHLANLAGAGNTNPAFDHCSALNNGADGFNIESLNSLTALTHCIAGGNIGSGINNASTTTSIVDSRSQHAQTTVNPTYNLNGAADIVGGATIVITS